MILGRAPGGFANEAIEFNIEGIPTEGYGDKAIYGGSDPADNSGILQYVSIRHGGAAIAPDNEINGLTLGSVGSGTTIDHIEIFANADDGIEWFGGTVALNMRCLHFAAMKHLIMIRAGMVRDNLCFQSREMIQENVVLRLTEAKHQVLNPKTVPVFSNVTQIGAGLGSGVSNNDAFRMKADGSGKFYNSIWTGLPVLSCASMIRSPMRDLRLEISYFQIM